jgi:hypothetical protein
MRTVTHSVTVCSNTDRYCDHSYSTRITTTCFDLVRSASRISRMFMKITEILRQDFVQFVWLLSVGMNCSSVLTATVSCSKYVQRYLECVNVGTSGWASVCLFHVQINLKYTAGLGRNVRQRDNWLARQQDRPACSPYKQTSLLPCINRRSDGWHS